MKKYLIKKMIPNLSTNDDGILIKSESKKSNTRHSDDAVSSVVGEMLVIALVLILVALLAISAFNMFPENRDTVTTISMNKTTDTIHFWHKGGDWIAGNKLTATLTPSNGGTKIILEKKSLVDCMENKTAVLDLGGHYSVTIPDTIDKSKRYSLRLSTDTNVIYAKDNLVIS